MGKDKATVDVGGQTMLERVVAAGQAIGEVAVIGREPTDDPDGVPDLREGRLGPLAGLETALVDAAGREVVLLAVDQPFLRAETVWRLLETTGDAVIPIDGGWEQITCGVYREPCLPHVTAALDEGELAINAILDRFATTRVPAEEWQAWGEDGRSWFSVDTPEALAEGMRRFG